MLLAALIENLSPALTFLFALLAIASTWGGGMVMLKRFGDVAERFEKFLLEHAKEHGRLDGDLRVLQESADRLDSERELHHGRIREIATRIDKAGID